MTAKSIYYTPSQKILTGVHPNTPGANTILGPYRKDDGLWYEKDQNGIERVLNQKREHISICEFMIDENVTVRNGLVYFVIPDDFDGRTISKLSARLFHTVPGGSLQLTTEMIRLFQSDEGALNIVASHVSNLEVRNNVEDPSIDIQLLKGHGIRFNVNSVDTFAFKGLSVTYTVE